MNDHDPCPRCRFENARCACPKKEGQRASREERLKLAESVTQAIEARKEATT